MKTVWVNRHNADGSMRPMSEWKLKECNQNQSHAYKVASGNYAFNFECLPSRHCLITPQGENEESGVFFEFIGNQRGDGWFYVADGDLPPIEDNAVLCHDDVGVRLMMPRALHKPNTWEYQNTVKCWQPIEPPRYLD